MFEDGFFVFTDWIVKHADHDQTVQVHGDFFYAVIDNSVSAGPSIVIL